MNVNAKVITESTQISLIQLEFPVPIQAPFAKSFHIFWGKRPIQVKAVSQLSDRLVVIHLFDSPEFPIFNARKYDIFPDSCLSKINISYNGAIFLEGNGEAVEKLVFNICV